MLKPKDVDDVMEEGNEEEEEGQSSEGGSSSSSEEEEEGSGDSDDDGGGGVDPIFAEEVRKALGAAAATESGDEVGVSCDKPHLFEMCFVVSE